jgi:bifunctional non-homologous end joining protein LigD
MASRKLASYQAKRDFTKTREPSGKRTIAPSKELRFVIQKHDATRLHYDLRLELDGVFKSWTVTKGPSIDPHDKRLAVEVEDHPLDYGDFEGTIPKGQYGGGTVQLWDRGYWRPVGNRTPEEMLRRGNLDFLLEGERLHGSWVLVRLRSDQERTKRNNWLLIKHHDGFEKEGGTDALMAEDRSVASGRRLSDIAAGKGRKPKPFMLGKAFGADAVRQSNRGDAAELQDAQGRSESLTRKRETMSRSDESSCEASNVGDEDPGCGTVDGYLEVFGEAATAAKPGKGAFDNPSRGSSSKPLAVSERLMISSAAMAPRSLSPA